MQLPISLSLSLEVWLQTLIANKSCTWEYSVYLKGPYFPYSKIRNAPLESSLLIDAGFWDTQNTSYAMHEFLTEAKKKKRVSPELIKCWAICTLITIKLLDKKLNSLLQAVLGMLFSCHLRSFLLLQPSRFQKTKVDQNGRMDQS